MVAIFAFSLGMLLGSLMIGTASWVYLKQRQFGFGGAALTAMGTILVGLAVWRTLDLSLSKEGLKLKFTTLEQKVEKASTQVQRVSKEQETITTASVELQQHILQGQLPTTGQAKNDVISLMQRAESHVNRGDYALSEDDLAALRAANISGVGFRVYPAFALAFEKQGKPDESVRVLMDLQNRVSDDVQKGYGYLSRDMTIGWVVESLEKYRRNVQDAKVAAKFDEVINALKEMKQRRG